MSCSSAHDNIIQSLYLLNYIDSAPLRQNVQRAVNRRESYHQLRRAVSYANFGKQDRNCGYAFTMGEFLDPRAISQNRHNRKYSVCKALEKAAGDLLLSEMCQGQK